MGFSEEMISAVRGDSRPEIDFLITSGVSGGSAIEPLSNARTLDPDRLFNIARLNKMLGWLPIGPNAMPAECAGLASKLLQVRLRTIAMNRRAMAVTLEVTKALTQAGLRHLVFKGPFQQLSLHKDPFRRPSGDIDLYVAPRDRKRANAVLRTLGFTPLEQDQSLWWVPFLGEQHFQRENDGAVIDLHHRLQQAGLPDWRGAEGVLDRAVNITHGDTTIPMLSSADGCLLMAISLAKALLAHEPCGWAVVDLTHWLACLDPAERTMLAKIAGESGQERTLALGIALARACSDHPSLQTYDPLLLSKLTTDQAVLRDLVFQPWQREAEAPRRRQMLRMLAQGGPHIFAIEAIRAALSQQVRKLLERRTVKNSAG